MPPLIRERPHSQWLDTIDEITRLWAYELHQMHQIVPAELYVTYPFKNLNEQRAKYGLKPIGEGDI